MGFIKGVQAITVQICLALAYLFVITPAGFLVRLVHDPMARRWESGKSSYRISRDAPFEPGLEKTF